jgi:hypothetical protein
MVLIYDTAKNTFTFFVCLLAGTISCTDVTMLSISIYCYLSNDSENEDAHCWNGTSHLTNPWKHIKFLLVPTSIFHWSCVLECHVAGDLIFAAPPDAIPTGPAPPNVIPAAHNAGLTWMGTETTSLRELRLRQILPLLPPTSALFPRRRRICSRPLFRS